MQLENTIFYLSRKNHIIEPSYELCSKTSKCCASLFFGSLFLKMFGKVEFIRHNGTMTFIKYKDVCYGITNFHVYEEIETNEVVYLALNNRQEIINKPIYESKKDPDLAIYKIDEKILIDNGKMPIIVDNQKNFFNMKNTALCVGFPGDKRKNSGSNTLSFDVYHVVGRPTDLKSEINIIDEIEKECDHHNFGGMSGGPIFNLVNKNEYKLIGIIYEGDTGSEESPCFNQFCIMIKGIYISTVVDEIEKNILKNT